MDKLAEEGVYFRNAFVTTPICAASRASIVLSQYERSHGYTFQQPPVSKKLLEDSYFEQLKQAGYYSGFMGKLGVRFQDRSDTSMFEVYFPFYMSSDLNQLNYGEKIRFTLNLYTIKPFEMVRNLDF